MLKLRDGFSGERVIVLPQIIVKVMEEDPLMSALHITDIGYYPKAEHHYYERKIPINQYIFIYCLDGSGWYRVGSREYKVTANQFFILHPGQPHAYGASKTTPWTIYWIHFKGTMARYYVESITHPVNVALEAHSRIGDRINLFEDIYNTLKAGFANENLQYACSLFHYYVGTLRYIQQYRKANGIVNDAEDAIELSIYYMKENMEKQVTLQDIADYVGYSSSYYSMLFKKKIGHSPLAYLNLLKMQHACFLLDSTDMKVNQICYKIGLEDVYYFSRLFKKIVGVSPSEYRLQKKG